MQNKGKLKVALSIFILCIIAIVCFFSFGNKKDNSNMKDEKKITAEKKQLDNNESASAESQEEKENQSEEQKQQKENTEGKDKVYLLGAKAKQDKGSKTSGVIGQKISVEREKSSKTMDEKNDNSKGNLTKDKNNQKNNIKEEGENETPNLPKEEKLEKDKIYSYKSWKNIDMLLYVKNSQDNLEKVKSKVYSFVKEEKRKNLYFAQPFSDENYILVVSNKKDNEKIDAGEWKFDLPNSIDGVFVSNENNELKIEEGIRALDGKNKFPEMVLFSGKITSDKPFGGDNLVGLPGNDLHGGVIALENTRNICGINFSASKTKLSKASNGGAISLGKEDLDLNIEGNSFNFDGSKNEMYKGIIGYTVNGKLNIENNLFKGENITEHRRTENYGMIHFMQRSNRSLELNISGNKFLNIASTSINISIDKHEKINITDNLVDGVKDSGINIFVFPNDYPFKNTINLKNNVIKNYGLGEYEGYTDNGAGKLAPSNDNEFGISLGYIMPTYGQVVNGVWTSNEKEIEDVLLRENTILSKEQNDKNNNVVNSKEVLIGQKERVINSKERINENRFGNDRHFFVITKNENGSITYGQNKENPTENITVGGLYITGTGNGVVNLPPTLHIKGDLIVDLPNGTINNHANVDGKVEIKAQSNILNDGKFTLETSEFTRKSAPNEGIKINITEIKNDKGEKVEKGNSKLENLKVFVNGKLLESGYTVDEANDQVIIEKAVADAWENKALIVIHFEDRKNKVSEIASSPLTVTISDKSFANFEFSSLELTHMNPENKEIRVKIKNLVDKNGSTVSPLQSKLKAKFLRYGKSVDGAFIKVDDDKDEIILTKELLAQLYATKYEHENNFNIGSSFTYTLEVSDEENGVGTISKPVNFKVLDNSFARFEFEKGLTFTQGEAPENGIKLYVKDILDTKGNKVSKEKSVLKGNINIEPFPVKRDDTDDSELIVERDRDGNFIREIFNPKFIKINDDEDSITFTREYLNKMKTQSDGSTESGVKIFTFKYNDQIAKVDMRSSKVALYIKKKEKERSKNIEISFKEKTLKLENGKVVTDGFVLNQETMVSDLLKNVIKLNPRQQVLIKGSDGNLRKSYDSLEKGDKLVVIAENADARAEYSIEIGEAKKPDLIKTAKADTIKSYNQSSLKYKQGIKVKDLISAITGYENVEFKVVGVNPDGTEYDVVVDSNVSTSHRLKATKDGKSYYWNLRPFNNNFKTRALLVGNSDYAGDKLDLVGPKNDLLMMETLFKGNNISNTKTDVMVVKNALKKDFIKAIHAAFEGATDDDVSYLYYSGHGNNVKNMSYLCTVDNKTLSDGSFDPSGWISVDELKAELDKVPGKKVIILDCCNAGGFIGKNSYDALSSPTNRGVDGERSIKDTSKAFIRNVGNKFTSESNDNNIKYLTDMEYKVIVASSANEYSFEDKKEGVGKFTKVLAMAGGLEDNQMKGDKNSDRRLSVDEAYDYLMKNVASISHIQVFPYKDNFTIFEDVRVKALDSDTRVDSDIYTINIRTDKYGKYYGNIQGKNGEKIDGNQTAEQFIGKFKKKHRAQTIAVASQMGMETIVLRSDEKLGERLLYLVVTAENGDISKYSFSSKNISNGNVQITSKSSNIEINKVIKAIKLTKNMTVKEFIGLIEKGESGQKLEIYPKGGTVPRDVNEKVGNLDYLLVTASDNQTKQKYNITLMAGDDSIKPDFGGDLIIEGNRIKSGKVKLTTDMTVIQFSKLIKNREQMASQTDPMMTGVYPKGSSDGPWARMKDRQDKLKNGDVFKIKPAQWNKQAVSYILEVEEASSQPKDSVLEVPKWSWQFKIAGENIVDQDDILGTDKKFEYITNSLSNKASFTNFEYFDVLGNKKQGSDFIEDGGSIKFFNGEKFKAYIIKFSNGGIIVPDENLDDID